MAKAAGRTRYTADAVPRPHLVAAPLSTTMAHASVEVDVERLRSCPGVVAALGPESDPGWLYSTNPHGGAPDTCVFSSVGRYAGEVVGAVAAVDHAALTRALTLGCVSERRLPAVTSLAGARSGLVLANPRYPGNVIAERVLGAAPQELEAALGRAAQRHRTTVALAASPHGFLERVAVGAQWRHRSCHLWSTTQCPRLVRLRLRELLGADVVMEGVFVGGGFGGKEEISLEPATALLSAACGGQAVLMELSRAHCTASYRARHGGEVAVETGFDEDGVFTARSINFEFGGGPYDGHSTDVLGNAMAAALRLYPYGTVGASGRVLATNLTLGGAYRGYGVTQAVFAVETHVDALAARLGIDRLEIRRRNVARAGARDPSTGVAMVALRGADCLAALAAELPAGRRRRPRDGRHLRGVGFALLVATSAAATPAGPDSAEVGLRFDAPSGRLVVETAVAEAGQGIHAAIVGTVARALGAPAELVSIEQPGGAGGPRDNGMFGSRGANVTCSAAAQAASELHTQLSRRAAAALSVSHVVIDLAAGLARSSDTPRTVPLRDMGSVRCVAAHATDQLALAFGVQAAEVSVDRLTGIVSVERVIAVHDVGVLLEADIAAAQVEGGVLQGIGGALCERLTHDSRGLAAQQGLLGYLMPTLFGAVPEVRTVFICDEDWHGQGTGAKGIGEAAIMAVPAAVANAIADATGVMPGVLPMTGEALLRAFTEADAAADLRTRAASPLAGRA